MFQIHLYEKGDFTFPKFPVNSYRGGNKDDLLKAIETILDNHDSGISKIVIENDEFGDTESVAEPQATMDLPEEKQGLAELNATKLALEMYETFASELITALTNIAGIKRALANVDYELQELQPGEVSYRKGQADAFEEIKERIAKEYTLAKQRMSYPGGEEAIRRIHNKKNIEVDKLLPENDIRCKYTYMKVSRFKRGLADLLEKFGVEGFILGKKFNDVDWEKRNTLIRQFIKNTSYDDQRYGTIEPDEI